MTWSINLVYKSSSSSIHWPLVLQPPVWMNQYCTFPLLCLPLWVSLGTLWNCRERVKMCTTIPWPVKESLWQRGKTAIRSDVIVCGLNTSSHVSCHETRKRLCVDQCGSSSLMTLCTGLMNNLDGITPALVALQLLPLCSCSPWYYSGYYWSGPIVLRSQCNYKGPVCTLSHSRKITMHSQGNWEHMSLGFYDWLDSQSATLGPVVFVLVDVLSLFYCLIGFIVAYVALLSRHRVHSQLKVVIPLCHVMQMPLLK